MVQTRSGNSSGEHEASLGIWRLAHSLLGDKELCAHSLRLPTESSLDFFFFSEYAPFQGPQCRPMLIHSVCWCAQSGEYQQTLVFDNEGVYLRQQVTEILAVAGIQQGKTGFSYLLHKALLSYYTNLPWYKRELSFVHTPFSDNHCILLLQCSFLNCCCDCCHRCCCPCCCCH